MRLRLYVITAALLAPPVLFAQQAPASSSEPAVTTHIDEHGTAYIARVVPVPETISPEAQESLAPEDSGKQVTEKNSVAHIRSDVHKLTALEEYRSAYPVDIASSTIAGVPVHIVTPLTIPPIKPIVCSSIFTVAASPPTPAR